MSEISQETVRSITAARVGELPAWAQIVMVLRVSWLTTSASAMRRSGVGVLGGLFRGGDPLFHARRGFGMKTGPPAHVGISLGSVSPRVYEPTLEIVTTRIVLSAVPRGLLHI